MRIVNVSKSYEKKVLDNINLEFNKCGLYLIHGESGTGKSTLFRIINGLEKPDEGFVEIASNESISYCSSDNQLIEHIKVKDMLGILSNDKNEINNLLEIFEIKSLKRKKINKLSSGERERLQIVLTLLKDTNVIFLDEPTENLDNKTTIKVLNYLKELSKEKIIVLISHDIKNVIEYADQIYLLENASLIEEKNYVGTKEPLATTSKELNKKGLINYSFKNLFKHPIIMMLNLLLIFTIYLILGNVFLIFSINNERTFQKIGENLEYRFVGVGGNEEKALKYHLVRNNTYAFLDNVLEYEKVKDYLDFDNPYNSFIDNYDMEDFSRERTKIYIPCIIQSGYTYEGKKVQLDETFNVIGTNYYYHVVGIINQQLDEYKLAVIISSKIDKFIFDELGIRSCAIWSQLSNLYYDNGNKYNGLFCEKDIDYIDDIDFIKDYCININYVTSEYEGYFYVGEFPKNDNEIMLNQPYLYASLNENNNIELLDDSLIYKYAGINNEINRKIDDHIFDEPIEGLKITGTIGYVKNNVVENKNYKNCYVSHEMYEKMCDSLKSNDYHYYYLNDNYATKESFKYMTPDVFSLINSTYKRFNYNMELKFISTIPYNSLALIMILVEIIFVKILSDDTLRDIKVLKLYNAKDKDIKAIISSNCIFKNFFRLIGFILGIVIQYYVLKREFSFDFKIIPVYSIWLIILLFIVSLAISLFYELSIYSIRKKKVLAKHE